MSETTDSKHSTGLEIAVVGMAGRFPGAADVDELWRNLCAGVESVTTFSEDEVERAGVPPALYRQPEYVRAGGVLTDADCFDAGFFGYSPREASVMDPQQRVFLQLAWSALESAGHDPRRFQGPVGVYAGVGLNQYWTRHVLDGAGSRTTQVDYQAVLGNDKDFLATRVAYKLDLTGPAVVVQCACSTSLVATHIACQGLLAGDCDLALAGGITIRLPQQAGYLYQEDGILSPDGHCRAFDASARGCVPGNGGAVVALRRLDDALADGDPIHAVIKGTAINNDGGHKLGFTAPRVDGQAEVIRTAQQAAEVDVERIGYIEAHGTGTALGDPIEVEALTRAFRESTDRRGYCAIGSVKSNLGHLDAGAGVTGLIKAVLAVRDGVIPPSLHFEAPNPALNLERTPFYVARERIDWPQQAGPRLAAVSSFGIGGTNAHAIVEAPPAAETRAPGARPWHILPLSARSPEALSEAFARLAGHLNAHRELPLTDVAHTLQVGRQPMEHRHAVVVRNRDEALASLSRPVPPTASAPRDGRVLVFLFPGQGSQHVDMGRDLYEAEPAFRERVDRCAEALRKPLGRDLREVLYPAPQSRDAAAEALTDTALAQPALFTISWSLAGLLTDWGLRPRAMIGHSIGEFVAACLAGVFSLEDALALVAERGRLMGSLPRGSMLAVPLDEEALRARLPDELSLAAVNSPGSGVVSGPAEAVAAFARSLEGDGIAARALHTSHAFHSAMMEPALAAFSRYLSGVSLRAPGLPFVSSLTGAWIEDGEATDPGYWARQLRGTVRFADGVRCLGAEDEPLLLEVGPGQTLATLARRTLGTRVPIVSSMRHPERAELDHEVLLEAIARAWVAGVEPDWAAIHGGAERPRRIPLPTYPFERHRHWLEPAAPGAASMPASMGAVRSDPTQWLHAPVWRRSEALPAPVEDGDRSWLVLLDEYGLGEALATGLAAAGEPVATVRAGARFERLDGDAFVVNPGRAEDYRALLESLASGSGKLPTDFVDCRALGPVSGPGGSDVDTRPVDTRAFFEALAFTQALCELPAEVSRRLTVVTSGVYDVSGEETLTPFRALALGPCKVAPLEYPGLACRHLDLEVPAAVDEAWIERTAAAVNATLRSPPRGAAVAIRGRYRWVQELETLQVQPRAEPERLLKRGGVYLITGGLGGIGLALAEHLARTVEARLVLTGRTPLPERTTWGAPDEPVGPEPARRRLDDLETGRLLTRSQNEEQDFPRRIAALCAAHAARALRAAGLEPPAGDTLHRSAIERQMAVVPAYRRLLDALLGMLQAAGIVALDGERVVFRDALERQPAPEEVLEAVCRDHPDRAALLRLTDHCGVHLEGVLSGTVPGTQVLFGETGASLLASGSADVLAHSDLGTCRDRVRDAVEALLSASADRQLRILEAGAGQGVLTEAILPLLEGRDVTYHFTDIGAAFVRRARRLAVEPGGDRLRFGVLDISRDAAEQGFARGSVDLVLAFNVVHAVPRIDGCLDHLRELLAPGGTLVLVESVRTPPWVHLVWGLTEGWWHYEDEGLRGGTPLLPASAWRECLRGAGFEDLSVHPPEPHDEAVDTCVLIAARAPTEAHQPAGARPVPASGLDRHSRVEGLRRLEALGAEYLALEADVADAAAMERGLAQARARFGRIDGVFHAALVLEDGALALKEPASAARVLAPKVEGTRVIWDLVRDEADFLVLFSSLVSLLGGGGQVDYCAASCFLDAFAQAGGRERGARILAVDWCAWREVGMAMRAELARGVDPADALPDGISPAQGIESLLLAIATGLPQVAVSAVPLGLPAARGSGDARSTQADTPGLECAADRAEASVPETGAAGIIARLWGEVLGVQEVAADADFFALGGDSIASLQFIAKAKAEGLSFTNEQVFLHPTLGELAALAEAATVSEHDAQPADSDPASGVPEDDPADGGTAPSADTPLGDDDLQRLLERIDRAEGEDSA